MYKMSKLTVDALCQVFSLLSYNDQHIALKKIIMDLSTCEKEKLLEEIFGEQRVLITVKGGIADIEEAPINVTIEIDDQDAP